MNRNILGLLGIALAVMCWAALLALRYFVFQLPLTLTSVAVELVLVFSGSVLFWHWILGILRSQAVEVRQHAEQLEALHDASIALTTEYELRRVLQKVVELSRVLTGARYGALGILDEESKHVDQFITSGLSPATNGQIGRFPKGEGLLGLMIEQNNSVRSAHVASDKRSSGFPPHHPPMESFLGVPIVSKGQVLGNLYLADKVSANEQAPPDSRNLTVPFTEGDQEILEMFARQAAIAIENAQLYHQNQKLAIMQERERIGMDLHDGVIQSIYAIGLLLDDTQHRLDENSDIARQRIYDAIGGLNDVIRNIRSYINDLKSHQFRGRSLDLGLEELARELRMYSLLDVQVQIDSEACNSITPEQANEIMHIAQEALVNIRKHAHASSVKMELTGSDEQLKLTIEDDGAGFGENGSNSDSGHGLRNMRERAERLSGTIEIRDNARQGTQVHLVVPTHVHLTPSAA